MPISEAKAVNKTVHVRTIDRLLAIEAGQEIKEILEGTGARAAPSASTLSRCRFYVPLTDDKLLPGARGWSLLDRLKWRCFRMVCVAFFAGLTFKMYSFYHALIKRRLHPTRPTSCLCMLGGLPGGSLTRSCSLWVSWLLNCIVSWGSHEGFVTPVAWVAWWRLKTGGGGWLVGPLFQVYLNSLFFLRQKSDSFTSCVYVCVCMCVEVAMRLRRVVPNSLCDTTAAASALYIQIQT